MKDNKGSDTLQKFVISKSFYSNEKTQWEWLRSILDSKIVRHIPCWTLNTPGMSVDKYEHGTERIREEKNHRRITKKVTNKTLKTSCERKNVFQEELFSSGWKQNLFKIWSTGWKQNITEKKTKNQWLNAKKVAENSTHSSWKKTCFPVVKYK